jgi:hypothetical protein
MDGETWITCIWFDAKASRGGESGEVCTWDVCAWNGVVRAFVDGNGIQVLEVLDESFNNSVLLNRCHVN